VHALLGNQVAEVLGALIIVVAGWVVRGCFAAVRIYSTYTALFDVVVDTVAVVACVEGADIGVGAICVILAAVVCGLGGTLVLAAYLRHAGAYGVAISVRFTAAFYVCVEVVVARVLLSVADADKA